MKLFFWSRCQPAWCHMPLVLSRRHRTWQRVLRSVSSTSKPQYWSQQRCISRSSDISEALPRWPAREYARVGKSRDSIDCSPTTTKLPSQEHGKAAQLYQDAINAQFDAAMRQLGLGHLRVYSDAVEKGARQSGTAVYPFAIAVSGGADSMALCLLAKVWAARASSGSNDINSCGKKLGRTSSLRHRLPLSLIVNHNLRTESSRECEHVKHVLNAHGIDACILNVTVDMGSCTGKTVNSSYGSGGGALGKVQVRAREARFQALHSACMQHGIHHLLMAHHANDHVETMLFRLARASGVIGLAGMQPSTALWIERGKAENRPDSPQLCTKDQSGFASKAVAAHSGMDSVVYLHRPLLGFTKSSLAQVCRFHRVQWVKDPSNASLEFDRVRVRAAVKHILESGARYRRTHGFVSNGDEAPLTTSTRLAGENTEQPLALDDLNTMVRTCQEFRNDVLQVGTRLLRAHSIPLSNYGAVLLHVESLIAKGVGEEVLAHLLGRVMAVVKGVPHVPARSGKLLTFARRLLRHDPMLARVAGTPLAGCSLDCVSKSPRGRVCVLLIRCNVDMRFDQPMALNLVDDSTRETDRRCYGRRGDREQKLRRQQVKFVGNWLGRFDIGIVWHASGAVKSSRRSKRGQRNDYRSREDRVPKSNVDAKRAIHLFVRTATANDWHLLLASLPPSLQRPRALNSDEQRLTLNVAAASSCAGASDASNGRGDGEREGTAGLASSHGYVNPVRRLAFTIRDTQCPKVQCCSSSIAKGSRQGDEQDICVSVQWPSVISVPPLITLQLPVIVDADDQPMLLPHFAEASSSSSPVRSSWLRPCLPELWSW